MAQEQGTTQTTPAWTKIFSAFKVALDMKKLLLAAAGIFLTFLGWWAIGWAFYSMRSLPVWDDNVNKPHAERAALWSHFRAKRASWNLIHELAGSPANHDQKFFFDAGDVAENFDQFLLLNEWEKAYRRLGEPIQLKDKSLEVVCDVDKVTLTFAGDEKDAETELKKLKDKRLTLRSLTITDKEGKGDEKAMRFAEVDGTLFKFDGAMLEKLKKYRDGARTAEQIARDADDAPDQKLARNALKIFNEHLVEPKMKPSGLLRTCPWSEYRGENHYVTVEKAIKTRGDSIFGGGRFFTWFFGDEMPVLLEPLFKFLAPIVYFFDARAGGWDRLYLIFITLWTLAIWGFFGGAICRIAAVQIARNERITLREAILFTRERFVSYFAAPALPLVLVAILVFGLMVFGWFIWIPYLGELVAGLLWPFVLMLGFTMAIVLVGLVGWPMMTATISTEGTDSFDALSRSYSYVYQAPWQFLWYNFLALIYGVALVFFVGFMASLMVFLGKWGVSSAVGPAKAVAADDREPSYLFYYAPRSYEWRDLLIRGNSSFVETRTERLPNGREIKAQEFKPEYEQALSWNNKVGAFLVALWIYPLFLLVVGFGYSYFWTASTIIYFLMRRYVDDTEMDEVHQEDEDFDDPFLKPTPPAPAAPPASKPGTVSLSVVDAPPAPSPVTSYTADDRPPPPPPPPAAEAPQPTPETPPTPPTENPPPNPGV